MKIKVLSLSLLIAFGAAHLSAKTTWKKASKSDVSGIEKLKTNVAPSSATVFKFDLNEIVSTLYQAPMRGTKNSAVILEFPNAQGQLLSYKVYEAPVMHPDLAARYPQMKSYVGYGIGHAHRIRFSVSPQKGLSGIILGGERAVFIDPYSADFQYFTVFERSGDDRKKTFKCLTNDVPYKPTKGTGSNKDADDQTLRTFELAMSATGEFTAYHGGTKPQALAAMNATMTRVNGVYEADFGITMVLIANNDDVIYTNAGSDPYGSNLNNELQSTLTSVIGEANYDIGHLVHQETNSNGNAGCIGCVCVNGQKGSAFTSHVNPTGDPFDIDYVAHEMGHQFGGNHTHTYAPWPENTGAQMEPGSGSTVMGYAGITGASDVQNNSDAYFHFYNIEQITTYVKSTGCQTNTPMSNVTPVANAGQDYTIPHSTAYVLEGSATDANTNDVLTFCWEQADEGFESKTSVNPTPNSGMSPSFRSMPPVTQHFRYIPELSDIVAGNLTTQWETVLTQGGTMNMALTVRDNVAGGGQNHIDKMVVTVDGNSGPFEVTSQSSNVTWTVGTSETITWNVANTTAPPVSCANVDIYLSLDGGATFWTQIASNVPNNGSYTMNVPFNSATTQARIMVRGAGNIFLAVNSSNFTIFSPTGISENSLSTINIYPNPTNNLINIDMGDESVQNIVITDVQGKLVYTDANITSQLLTIDASNFAKGLYVVKITTDSGISVHKITKE